MRSARQVAALFVRADSIYHGMPAVDAFDANRDARTWQGGAPVVAHPPCAQWGRLKRFARADADERAMGPWAVSQVRTFGGVLEHPAWSDLWSAEGLPLPGKPADAYGGWTLSVQQFWWGHKAAKATWLYIVGCKPRDVPAIPLDLAQPRYVIASSKNRRDIPEVTKAEREHTPALMAEWLVELARECVVQRKLERVS